NGTLGITMHRMPQIGELGPGIWLASGFGGHGLNTTAMAGNIIARAVVAGDQTWRQFTPFELVWAGGPFGRIAAQCRVWIKRLRDALEERRAMAREHTAPRTRDVQAPQPAPEAMAGAPQPEPDVSVVPPAEGEAEAAALAPRRQKRRKRAPNAKKGESE